MSENKNNNDNTEDIVNIESAETTEIIEATEATVETVAENDQSSVDESIEIAETAEAEPETEDEKTETVESVENIEPEPVAINEIHSFDEQSSFTENTESMAIAENISAQTEKNKRSKNGQNSFKNSVFGTAAILGIITVVTVLAISVLNSLTAPVIEKRLADEKDKSIKYLFGYDVYSEILTGFEIPAPVTDVTAVYDNSLKELVGYCVTVAPKGFADKIIMIVAVNTDITVRDTQILSMSETAGYGTKINDEKESWFREQFKSRVQSIKDIRTEPLPGENSIRIIAGATVSSKAFLNGVNSALDAVGGIKNQMEREPEKIEESNLNEIQEMPENGEEEVNGDG